MGIVKKVLFSCSQNRLRSPTAEQVFLSWKGLELASAGTNNDAGNPVTAELIVWADIVFVMERPQRDKLQKSSRCAEWKADRVPGDPK